MLASGRASFSKSLNLIDHPSQKRIDFRAQVINQDHVQLRKVSVTRGKPQID